MIKNIEVPKHLKSTYNLISLTFPIGIDESEYFPLLALLYDYMSDRCLAEVISLYSGKKYVMVLNDIYKIASNDKPTEVMLENIRSRLIKNGYQEWISEE